MSTKAYFEIQDTLFNFMRSFDKKDWDTMKNFLFDPIDCDYSKFHGAVPGKVTREQYISQRKENLSDLITQHNLLNLVISFQGQTAKANCNFIIYRFNPKFSGEKELFYHSYGQYIFELKKQEAAWKIISIVQMITMNEGNPNLHGAKHS